MTLVRHSKAPLPIERVLTGLLGEAEKDAILSAIKPEIHGYEVGSYACMMPSTRARSKFIVWDRIDQGILQSVRSGEAELLLDMSVEAISDLAPYRLPELNEIYSVVVDLDLPPERITISNSNALSGAVLEQVARERGLKPIKALSADFVFAHYWAFLKANDAPEIGGGQTTDLDEPLIPFLSFNRKIRPHRLSALIAALVAAGPSGCLYSLLGSSDTQTQADVRRECLGSIDLHFGRNRTDPAISAAVDHIVEHFPRYASAPLDRGTSDSLARTTESGELFKRTLLSLVGESSFAGPGSSLITEKLLKPIIAGHPFIVIGDQGLLDRLRNLGFSTFGAAIDEGYDEIVDPVARFQAVASEIGRIGGMTQTELTAMRRALLEPASANAMHLRSGFATRFRETAVEAIAATWT